MHNYGKLTMERTQMRLPVDEETVTIVTIGVCYDAEHVEWHDVVERTPSKWYIAVTDDGTVVSAEQDPEQSQVPGFTIIGLDGLGGFENHHGNGSVYGKHWNGEEVVPWDAS